MVIIPISILSKLGSAVSKSGRVVKTAKTEANVLQGMKPQSSLTTKVIKASAVGGAVALTVGVGGNLAGSGISAVRQGFGFPTDVEKIDAQARRLQGVNDVAQTFADNPFLIPVASDITGTRAEPKTEGLDLNTIIIIGAVIAGGIAIAYIIKKK